MSDETSLIHHELSERIIGAATTVLNTLRLGLDEKVYENALVIELAEQGLRLQMQQPFNVHDKRHFIGKLIPDLIFEDKFIVDLKVAESFCESDVAQVLGYLAITNLQLGLLLNFKYSRLKWNRVVRSNDRVNNREYRGWRV